MGTPQGSVLGPLIFLLYVNDLPEYVTDGEVFIYADDTCIVVHDISKDYLIEKVRLVIGSFQEWCGKNHLLINMEKTVLLNMSQTNKLKTINVDHKILEPSSNASFLGVILNDSLSWEPHIEALAKKLNKACYALNILKRSFTSNTLIDIYYAYVYSIVSYAIAVWGNSGHAHRIFVGQKRALRIIYNLSYRQSCRETFRGNRILTVPCIYIYKLCSRIHSERNRYRKRSDIHDHDTRNKGNLELVKQNREKYKKSPYYAGITIYNSLPSSLKDIVELRVFKNKLRSILCENAFYSVYDFGQYCREGCFDN